jgi:hypothetical protein
MLWEPGTKHGDAILRSMAAVTFDTLKFANRLKQAGVPDKQAEAEAEVLAEALQVNLKDLVTKEDLHTALDALEGRLGARIADLDSRLGGRIADLDSRLGGRIADLDSRLGGRIDTLEAKVSGELTLVKWMLGLLMGGVAALILKAFF